MLNNRRLINDEPIRERIEKWLEESDAYADTEAYIACLYELTTAPTVDAEPIVHSKWQYDETIGGMKHYYCTNCNKITPGNECFADENQILWFAFCPKCGAKMDLGDQDATD